MSTTPNAAVSKQSKYSTAKPMEFRQRRPRQTANPVVSSKPDIFLEFNTSKLGIRVRGGDNKQGLYVAAVTNEAPPQARDVVPEGAQIISVNEHNLEKAPFDEAVEHFAQLTLPISVRFRPPLHPPKKQQNQHSHHHGHDHDHHHHHHDEDDEEEGTCYIACYMILFVICFMFLVSVALNGWPGIPTALPSMPRLFPAKGSRGRSRRDRGGAGDPLNDIESLVEQKKKLSEQLRKKNNNGKADGSRRLLYDDILGDMNNINNILNEVDINLEDIEVDDLINMDKKKKT
eukprot:CAMPEP_0197033262 /NCGR_PEP_ID=MMETSP1384-20130603/11719_1 /TAXON_ID=29189 /ORGANISM="Ammonia sp." /LENGTH=287 /DNA_ID=CAMNT_0042463051 /DNA_START=31 /DNA_END=894 /DNA_ORIENTATION=+